ncbi:YdbC family protein [Paenibacillus silvae]|nr:YdbC family protein [Paenibacillus silvae]MCK6148617.1 YdbC family protein [Paenibacillus silvae]MCK6266917.1 YdbC family protein [Paenibacillus silvae]
MDAYTFFMSEIHDKIITSNEQTQSYEQIEISLWKTNEIISHTEITNFKCSKLIDLRNQNLRTNDLSKNTIHMTQLKDEKVRKVLILNNELEETSEGNDEILLKFEKEWTV